MYVVYCAYKQTIIFRDSQIGRHRRFSSLHMYKSPKLQPRSFREHCLVLSIFLAYSPIFSLFHFSYVFSVPPYCPVEMIPKAFIQASIALIILPSTLTSSVNAAAISPRPARQFLSALMTKKNFANFQSRICPRCVGRIVLFDANRQSTGVGGSRLEYRVS